MLAIFSGADVYSASIVVAAFMAGLGCGSLLGGWIADRVSRVRCLVLFSAAEIAVALFGFFSKAFLYDLLYQQLGHLVSSPAVTAGVLFASLLWPTTLMGLSLPLLSRALTWNVAGAAATVGSLYAANTLGAAFGALFATWWLLPDYGLEKSLHIAAVLNVVCAAGAWPIARAIAKWTRTLAPGLETTEVGLSAALDQFAPECARSSRFATWMLLFALSGFIALSFEIVWFRLLSVMLKSTTVTFGTLLALYLFWLGLGSAVGSVAARRMRDPALGFLMAQTAASLYAAASLAAFVAVIETWPPLAWLYRYFGNYEPLGWSAASIPPEFFGLYVALPVFLFGPATFLMGFSFPLLQKVVQLDLAHVGRRVGALLVANIAGGTIGTILTGWLLLTWLGTTGTLVLIVAASSVFALPAIRRMNVRRRRIAYVALASVMLAAITSIPGARTLWARLHGTAANRVMFAEDGSGVSVLKTAPGSRDVDVFLNGLGQSRLPYGDIHTALGALPAIVHPSPRDALVIGLGSGDTLHAVAARGELQRITSIEIVRPQIDTLQQLSRHWPYSGLLSALHDPRIEHAFGDGRLYIRRAGRRYDIIEADALRPGSAYAGNLYSNAYFELVRRHLNPGGLAVTWSPTPRVARTFVDVLPHVVGAGAILIGSNEPIPFNRNELLQRLDDPRFVDYFAMSQVDIKGVLSPLIRDAKRIERPRDPRLAADINTDLYPRDEFGIPP